MSFGYLNSFLNTLSVDSDLTLSDLILYKERIALKILGFCNVQSFSILRFIFLFKLFSLKKIVLLYGLKNKI